MHMTPQEAAEQYADNKYGKNLILPVSCEIHEDGLIDFMAGAKWQSEQDNQALSSALKEINDLKDVIKLRHSTQKMTLDQLNDALKEIAELHAKVKELQEDLEHNAKRAIEIAGERDKLEDKVEEWKAKYYGDKTITLKKSDRLTNESTSQPDSANLPPESAT